ncbi:START-like domain superfamily [Sesbania bispinosa]|nr:START-like domain superfamily [Sesbania bispinosa]
MAKYGEGDKRWIVEERPDGTNVHNWHWAETNCLEWSRTFFTNLLSNLPILQGEANLFIKRHRFTASTAKPTSTSERGKSSPATRSTSHLIGKVKPKTPKGYRYDEGPIGKRIKDAMVSKGKPLILEKKPSSAAQPKQNHATAADAKKNGGGSVEKKESKKGKKVISLTERFNCRAKDLYEILMDENRWKGFTQSNARISKEEAKLIVQRWRFGSWNDGVQSQVRLVFEEPEPGVTIVKLTHTDVPEEDRYGNATVVENTERGWRDLIFQRIRAVFGFGI